MVNISSFGKILRSEGLSIKSIAQKVYKDKEGAQFLVNLKNGSQGVYTVSKDTGCLRQSLSAGGKTVDYTSKQLENMGLVDVFSKKAGDYVTLPQTQNLSYVKDNGKITFASKFTRTPVSSKCYRDPLTGNVKTKVNTTQELHEDKFLSGFVLPTDIRIGADGNRYPIFERPMSSAKPSVNVWNI